MREKYIAVIIVSTMFLLSTKAVAQENAGNEAPFFGVSLGVKGGAGGNYLTEPDDVPLGAIVYEEGAGGWGAGGGLYTELRALWGYLGLEIDLLFDHSRNWSSNTINNVVEINWISMSNALRIPLLLKGNIEMESVRFYLGIGPEFVIGLDAGTDIEVTEGSEYVGQDDINDLKQLFKAKTQTDTYLCVDLGLAVKVWELAITVDLRYGYNLTQPSKYEDRVNIENVGGNSYAFTTISSNTMDGRILLGLAYEFGFDY